MSDKAKKTQNKPNRSKDGHVDFIDSSLLGSGKSDRRKGKETSLNSRQKNGNLSASFSSLPSSSRPLGPRSRTDDNRLPTFKEPRKRRDPEPVNDRHQNSSRSRPSDNSRSQQRTRNVRPRSPGSPRRATDNLKDTSKNTFSIKHASLPPIVVLENLAPGTTSDDVRVSLDLLFSC